MGGASSPLILLRWLGRRGGSTLGGSVTEVLAGCSFIGATSSWSETLEDSGRPRVLSRSPMASGKLFEVVFVCVKSKGGIVYH